MKRFAAFARRVLGTFLKANASMHAGALTYFSLLTVIPAICCMLVLAKACGVDDLAREQINRHLDAAITNIEHGQDDGLAVLASGSDEERAVKRKVAVDLGRQARQISQSIFERINAFDINTFGWIGFLALLWSLVSSLGMVELSFNGIWGVERPRPLWKRGYVYLFVMTVLPVLAAAAMSIPVLNIVRNAIVATAGSTSATRWLSDGLVAVLDSWLFRYALTLLSASVAFGFFYWLMPNCRVRVSRAWFGGLVTSALFGGWIRLCAVAQVGIARSSALYGSFAFLPIVLAWLYMSWQIVLFGACVVKTSDESVGGEKEREIEKP